jgi:hypothetical protein
VVQQLKLDAGVLGLWQQQQQQKQRQHKEQQAA